MPVSPRRFLPDKALAPARYRLCDGLGQTVGAVRCRSVSMELAGRLLQRRDAPVGMPAPLSRLRQVQLLPPQMNQEQVPIAPT